VFAEERNDEAVAKNAEGATGWKALVSLFRVDSRDKLATLFGFSKLEIAARIAEAIETLKTAATDASTLKSYSEVDITDHKMHEPAVSFAEPERQDNSGGDADESGPGGMVEKSPSEKTPSEVSGSGGRLVDGESTTASLFGDDDANGVAQ
jgi:protein transport protein SEC31